VGLGLLLRSRNNIFYGVGLLVPRQTPTLEDQGIPFCWIVTLDLSGMGGPTSSIRYCQHSSRDHLTTQAPPLRQSRDAFGRYCNYTVEIMPNGSINCTNLYNKIERRFAQMASAWM
jgi:hypothetical protein